MFDQTDNTVYRVEGQDILAGLTYLVIDDSKFSRSLIKNALHGFGFRNTVEAVDAVEGLALMRKLRVDVVLVDYEMPIITGIEFTKMARRDPDIPNPALPIIMVSGYSERDKVLEARNAGVHEYLAKPFAPEHLLRRIAKAVLDPRPFIRTKAYVGPERREQRLAVNPAKERRQKAHKGYPQTPDLSQVA